MKPSLYNVWGRRLLCEAIPMWVQMSSTVIQHLKSLGEDRIVAIFIYMSYAINVFIIATASVTYIPIHGEMYTLYHCHN